MSDDFDELPPEIAELLRRERQSTEGPSEDARARVRSRLGATLGLGLGAGATLAGGGGKAAAATGKLAATGKGAMAGATLVKLALATLVAGGLVTGGWLVHRARSGAPAATDPLRSPAPPSPALAATPSPALAATPSPAPAAAPSPSPSPAATPTPALAPPSSSALAATPSSAPTPLPTVTPSSAPAVPHPARPSPSARATSAHRLAEEQALLERARAALAAEDGAAALAAVERHARRFPDGQLAEERDSLRVRALAATGDAPTARRRATEFEARYPDSLFLPMVRAARDGSP